MSLTEFLYQSLLSIKQNNFLPIQQVVIASQNYTILLIKIETSNKTILLVSPIDEILNYPILIAELRVSVPNKTMLSVSPTDEMHNQSIFIA